MKKYKVSEYIEELKRQGQVKDYTSCESIMDKEIDYVSYNSSDIKKDTMFICKGQHFKKSYLYDAIANGACIYVSHIAYTDNIPCILVKDPAISLSIISNMYVDFVQNKLNIVAITGTKGKTTTASYIKNIFDIYMKQQGKKDTAIISSTRTYDGVLDFESHITTPESLELQKHFQNANESGVENIIMEASSQALKYARVYSVDFDIGVFLNISEDHISPVEHPDFNDYFNSKLKIFEKSKKACVNLDSDISQMIYDIAKRDSKEVITFSTKQKEADVFCYDIVKDDTNTKFKVRTGKFDSQFVLTMPGLFNVENALAAISVCVLMIIPSEIIYKGLINARSSGRMEIFKSKDDKIISIVDYAHNKLSFEKIYESTKQEYPDRKIVTVFGCPGNKALGRRKNLGELAGKNSDIIYLTADDPGEEDVLDICKEISKNAEAYNSNIYIIEDRKEAIKEAIAYAREKFSKSVVIVTGKGSETTQKVGGKLVPYISDAKCVEMYIDN